MYPRLVTTIATLIPLLVLFAPRVAAQSPTTAPSSAWRIYVSNERSGDVSVIDPSTNTVIATIPVGKRPRGIRASRDGRLVYVALSGTPIAPPRQKDEDTPKGDRAADGIGVIDVAAGRLIDMLPSGSDPEQFAVS